MPHLQPDFFDRLIVAQLPQAGDYLQIGGWRGKSHRGFLPTGEMVLFILGGSQFADTPLESLRDRLGFQQVFSERLKKVEDWINKSKKLSRIKHI